MTPELFAEIALSPALGLLPMAMDRVEARAFLIAIALQESKLEARRQFGAGPARSYFQFELGKSELHSGVTGVLEHKASKEFAHRLCLDLDIGPTAPAVYEAIEFSDVLACGIARLSLWTLRKPLPARTMATEAWIQYLLSWNPGKPHVETWADNWEQAWAVVTL